MIPVYLASYDVTSLFTKISLQVTVKIVWNTIFSNRTIFHGFDHSSFKKLLALAFYYQHIFLFNGRNYKRTDSVVMGSPLGPTLANIFMRYHESIWLDNCPDYFKSIIYKRYVDDTFACFSDPHHLNLFLDYLNSQHGNIKFTGELASNSTLPFLDCKISVSGNSFHTSIYRKSSFTNL